MSDVGNVYLFGSCHTRWLLQVDYFIRAKRLEEIPLLEEYAREKATNNRKQWDLMEAQRVSYPSLGVFAPTSGEM